MRFGSIVPMAASNPDRDRRLAGRPRYRFRAANPLADEIQDLLGSETFRRLKRFQKVTDALKSSLGNSGHYLAALADSKRASWASNAKVNAP